MRELCWSRQTLSSCWCTKNTKNWDCSRVPNLTKSLSVLLKSKLQTQVLFQIKTMYRLRPSTIYGWFLSKSYEGRLAGKLFWPVALLAPCCFNNLEMCINNSEVRWMTLGPELCLALGWSQYFHLTLYANEVTWFRNPFLTVSVECSGQYREVLCFSPHLLYLFYIFYI